MPLCPRPFLALAFVWCVGQAVGNIELEKNVSEKEAMSDQLR